MVDRSMDLWMNFIESMDIKAPPSILWKWSPKSSLLSATKSLSREKQVNHFLFSEKLFIESLFFIGKKKITITILPLVYIWKRAQILVAEIWAAFYPPSPDLVPHPIFPGIEGPKIHLLTMFADYRVPQILHHLRILSYPPSLVKTLQSNSHLAPGSREELSLRSASIVAVERLRDEILLLIKEEDGERELALRSGEVSSVLIDFYLWDLAKKIEGGEEKIDGLETAEIVPAHRTRSIWY